MKKIVLVILILSSLHFDVGFSPALADVVSKDLPVSGEIISRSGCWKFRGRLRR